MAKFIVYEIWTRASMVDADSPEQAYELAEPKPVAGMALSNWHAVQVPEVKKARKRK